MKTSSKGKTGMRQSRLPLPNKIANIKFNYIFIYKDKLCNGNFGQTKKWMDISPTQLWRLLRMKKNKR